MQLGEIETETPLMIDSLLRKLYGMNYISLLYYRQKKNWRDYIGSDNLVVAARLSEMGYKDEERVQVKKEFKM